MLSSTLNSHKYYDAIGPTKDMFVSSSKYLILNRLAKASRLNDLLSDYRRELRKLGPFAQFLVYAAIHEESTAKGFGRGATHSED